MYFNVSICVGVGVWHARTRVYVGDSDLAQSEGLKKHAAGVMNTVGAAVIH